MSAFKTSALSAPPKANLFEIIEPVDDSHVAWYQAFQNATRDSQEDGDVMCLKHRAVKKRKKRPLGAADVHVGNHYKHLAHDLDRSPFSIRDVDVTIGLRCHISLPPEEPRVEIGSSEGTVSRGVTQYRPSAHLQHLGPPVRAQRRGELFHVAGPNQHVGVHAAALADVPETRICRGPLDVQQVRPGHLRDRLQRRVRQEDAKVHRRGQGAAHDGQR